MSWPFVRSICRKHAVGCAPMRALLNLICWINPAWLFHVKMVHRLVKLRSWCCPASSAGISQPESPSLFIFITLFDTVFERLLYYCSSLWFMIRVGRSFLLKAKSMMLGTDCVRPRGKRAMIWAPTLISVRLPFGVSEPTQPEYLPWMCSKTRAERSFHYPGVARAYTRFFFEGFKWIS